MKCSLSFESCAMAQLEWVVNKSSATLESDESVQKYVCNKTEKYDHSEYKPIKYSWNEQAGRRQAIKLTNTEKTV